jgi:hypothetical protein
MRREERAQGLSELLRMAMSSHQSGMWTALPATVVSYDSASQTCIAQTMVKMQRRLQNPQTDSSGKKVYSVDVDIPPLLDVPVLFPSGGGFTLTFPVAKGDELLVVFASRCIDAWWKLGRDQDSKGNVTGRPQMELRMHDLSDGFAILQPRSQVRMLSPAPSTASAQLRSDDGQAVVEIAANHVVNIICANANVTATNTATVKAPTIKLQNAGSALKKLVTDTFVTLFNSHTHPVAGANTTAPTQQSSADTTSVVSAE